MRQLMNLLFRTITETLNKISLLTLNVGFFIIVVYKFEPYIFQVFNVSHLFT